MTIQELTAIAAQLDVSGAENWHWNSAVPAEVAGWQNGMALMLTLGNDVVLASSPAHFDFITSAGHNTRKLLDEVQRLTTELAGTTAGWNDAVTIGETSVTLLNRLDGKLDHARAEITEAKGLLGEGGDGTLKGRIESMLSERAELRRLLASAQDFVESYLRGDDDNSAEWLKRFGAEISAVLEGRSAV